MHLAHIFASGMGGIRTSGDLVAWIQLIKKMKITEAKQYVAQKLGVEIADMTNEEVMRPLREDLGIGIITSVAGSPKGMRAKLKIAEMLDVRINSVNLFKLQMGV
jgi:dimethylamine--corrinoid protein Co-methyltransferase